MAELSRNLYRSRYLQEYGSDLIPTTMGASLGATFTDPILHPLQLMLREQELMIQGGEFPATEELKAERPRQIAPAQAPGAPPEVVEMLQKTPDLPPGLMEKPELGPVPRPIPAESLVPPERLNDMYGHLGLKFDQPETAGYARQLAEYKLEEKMRNDIIERGPRGFLPGAASFGTMFVSAALDPFNLAAAMVPIVGEARGAALIASLGRTVGRFSRGAIEGAVGNAAIEPVVFGLSEQQQLDYGLADALLNVTLGAVIGGPLHLGIGKLHDVFGNPEVAESSFRLAMAQVLDGRRVDVTSVIGARGPERAKFRESLLGESVLGEVRSRSEQTHFLGLSERNRYLDSRRMDELGSEQGALEAEAKALRKRIAEPEKVVAADRNIEADTADVASFRGATRGTIIVAQRIVDKDPELAREIASRAAAREVPEPAAPEPPQVVIEGISDTGAKINATPEQAEIISEALLKKGEKKLPAVLAKFKRFLDKQIDAAKKRNFQEAAGDRHIIELDAGLTIRPLVEGKGALKKLERISKKDKALKGEPKEGDRVRVTYADDTTAIGTYKERKAGEAAAELARIQIDKVPKEVQARLRELREAAPKPTKAVEAVAEVGEPVRLSRADAEKLSLEGGAVYRMDYFGATIVLWRAQRDGGLGVGWMAQRMDLKSGKQLSEIWISVEGNLKDTVKALQRGEGRDTLLAKVDVEKGIQKEIKAAARATKPFVDTTTTREELAPVIRVYLTADRGGPKRVRNAVADRLKAVEGERSIKETEFKRLGRQMLAETQRQEFAPQADTGFDADVAKLADEELSEFQEATVEWVDAETKDLSETVKSYRDEGQGLAENLEEPEARAQAEEIEKAFDAADELQAKANDYEKGAAAAARCLMKG